jgi:hypothetical protein
VTNAASSLDATAPRRVEGDGAGREEQVIVVSVERRALDSIIRNPASPPSRPISPRVSWY